MATILLVGENHMLSYSRAQLLREWKADITDCDHAGEAIRVGAYDLLILCHTVKEGAATRLAEQVSDINPTVKVLTLCRAGQNELASPNRYAIEMLNPRGFRDAVLNLMDWTNGRPAFREVG